MRNGTKGQAMRLPKGLPAFEEEKEQQKHMQRHLSQQYS